MAFELRCACGVVLTAATAELLLEAVEGHARVPHAEPSWQRGPTVADLGRFVAALGRRVEALEQREPAS